MNEAQTVYVKHAQEVIKYIVKGLEFPRVELSDVPKELLLKRACFVSIHNTDGSLRGCIGTIEPVKENLNDEIFRNAQAACTRDTRFESVIEEELITLSISVDVLSIPERIFDIESLDPREYGIIISDNHFKKAVLLPNLHSIKTVDDQISIVKRKAGININGIDGLNLYRFTSVRYY